MASSDASRRLALAVVALVAGCAVSGASSEAESLAAYGDDPQLQAGDAWGAYPGHGFYLPGYYIPSHYLPGYYVPYPGRYHPGRYYPGHYHPGHYYRRWRRQPGAPRRPMGGLAAAPLDEASKANGPGQVRLRVRSNFSAPVLLATSCTENRTLGAGEEAEVRVAAGGALWVVPDGAQWDCHRGCADCFYVAAAPSKSGNLSAAVGFGVWQEEDTVTDAETEAMLAEEGSDALESFLDSLQRDGGGPGIAGVRLSAEQGAEVNEAGCPQGLCNANQMSLKQGSVVGVVIHGLDASGTAPKLQASAGWWGGYGGYGGYGCNPMRPRWGHPAYHPWHPVYGHPAYNPMHPAWGHPAYNPWHPMNRWGW